MQLLPSKELSPFIKHYLFLENEGFNLKRLRLFSDGNTGMVITLKNNLKLDYKENNVFNSLPNSFLYGQITEFKDILLLNNTSLIIVVFQPDGMKKLLGLPAVELQDDIIKTDEVFGKRAVEMEDKLTNKVLIEDKLMVLNSFFTELISERVYADDLFISASIDFIIKHKGLISINQLVKYIGYSERHIERKVLESIGVNPKRFINIIKLHNFLKHLNNKSDFINLTKIAYEAGYADQSHLIKEFRKNTGMTPKLYLNKTDKLTVNFVEFLPSI